MTIYKQELMRKLPHYGCIGSYSGNEATLSFSYNGIKIGWMEKDGYALFCAAKDLYLGTGCLTVSDLADKSLVPPKI